MIAITLKGTERDQAENLEVRTDDGQLVCRINLFANRSTGWADVDVIVDPKVQIGTMLAWQNGRELVRQELPGVSVLAIDIKRVAP